MDCYEIKEKFVVQQRLYVTKKEGFFLKSFAKQTDTFISAKTTGHIVEDLANRGACFTFV